MAVARAVSNNGGLITYDDGSQIRVPAMVGLTRNAIAPPMPIGTVAPRPEVSEWEATMGNQTQPQDNAILGALRQAATMRANPMRTATGGGGY